MSAIDRVTERLLAYGCSNKGKDWVCPSHADNDPSLSVNEGVEGVIMKCHAGCDNETIVETLGLTMADLFDAPLTKTERRRIVETYPYTDEAGELLYEVVRYEPKDFRQRVPDRAGGWKWSITGVRRVIYRLPDVRAAIDDGHTVYIVEGEKDADAFIARGHVATCNSGGAGKWRDEFAPFLERAHVVIVADNDEAGTKHAEQVFDSLVDVVQTLQLVRPKEGKDAFDHFRAGYSVDEFLPATTGEDPPAEVAEVVETNSLKADLLTYSEIKNIPPPTYIVGDLVVADSLYVLFGLPGSTKSFIALDWSLSMSHGVETWMGRDVLAGPVLYVVAEGLSGIGQRVVAWETRNKIEGDGHLTWLRRPVNLLDPKSVDDLVEIADEIQPMHVVFDTLARSMPGADENAPGPMSAAIEAMDAVRAVTRAAVGAIHHTPKDGSTPRGHSSLLGAVQTAMKVENDSGNVKLTVEKQKDGENIQIDMSLQKVAESAVLFPARRGADVSASIETELELQRIMREAVGAEGISTGSLQDISGMSKRTLFRAKRGLETRGVIINIGSGSQPRWRLAEI